MRQRFVHAVLPCSAFLSAHHDNVRSAYSQLINYLSENHAQVRYVALTIVNYLFQRSALFRQLLVADFQADFQAVVDEIQRERARQAANAQRTAEEQAQAQQELRNNVTEVLSNFATTTTMIRNSIAALTAEPASNRTADPFADLVPAEPSSKDTAASGSDDEETPDNEASAADAAHDRQELMQLLGTSNPNRTLTISLDDRLQVQETPDNRVLIDELNNLMHVAGERYLPQVRTWLNHSHAHDFSQAELKKLMDAREEYTRTATLYNQIHILPMKERPSSVNEDDDVEFEDAVFVDPAAAQANPSAPTERSPGAAAAPPAKRARVAMTKAHEGNKAPALAPSNGPVSPSPAPPTVAEAPAPTGPSPMSQLRQAWQKAKKASGQRDKTRPRVAVRQPGALLAPSRSGPRSTTSPASAKTAHSSSAPSSGPRTATSSSGVAASTPSRRVMTRPGKRRSTSAVGTPLPSEAGDSAKRPVFNPNGMLVALWEGMVCHRLREGIQLEACGAPTGRLKDDGSPRLCTLRVKFSCPVHGPKVARDPVTGVPLEGDILVQVFFKMTGSPFTCIFCY
ncbi:uncharacterized protein MONBRDRAFT_28310 [Monosiga brevicollis MX1]|uniref:Uncharacterized protein n=1 Tax=Monosiga brevicollis TaxID=81824 RepID=A9V7T1_MONBE|nr:uncharacterized protein MONBRDRAFT_28310 [Monosiga brevicollis MX1]EDQ86358.1 predicted protein [Monosiga brevicollis MX1]|eukprot:XP_001748748.1 hypothetical protein [Monosiga brevicollis MX1]